MRKILLFLIDVIYWLSLLTMSLGGLFAAINQIFGQMRLRELLHFINMDISPNGIWVISIISFAIFIFMDVLRRNVHI